MSERTFRKSAIVAFLVVAVLALSGCFPKKIMADDTLKAPAPREITGRLYESTVGQLLDSPAAVGEVWLLPTPTPVPNDLFDKVFGKAKEMIPTVVAIPVQRTELWGTVTVPALNVRSGPSGEAGVIAGLTLDQRVKVEKVEGEWLQVKLDDGQLGWSAAEYIVVEETVVSLAKAAVPSPTAPSVSSAAHTKGIVLADSLNVRNQPNTAGGLRWLIGPLSMRGCAGRARRLVSDFHPRRHYRLEHQRVYPTCRRMPDAWPNRLRSHWRFGE